MGYTYKEYDKNVDSIKVFDFLNKINEDFTPRFSDVVDLKEYSIKIAHKATIITAERNDKIIGMVAFYFNKKPGYSYWTFLGVLKKYRSSFIATQLEKKIIKYCLENVSKGIKCVVSEHNKKLIKVHKLFDFKEVGRYYDEEYKHERIVLQLDFYE